MEAFTGHGSQYCAMRGGKSQSDTKLEEMEIKHISAAVGEPTTREESREGSACMMMGRGRPMTAARILSDSDRQMHL